LKKYTWRLDTTHSERPFDRTDPESAETAVALAFPHELSDNAWRVLNYLDDTAWLFAYKGKLVVTDESLELTNAGDGSAENPIGCPRWTGSSFEELEAWLEHEFQNWQTLPVEQRPFGRHTKVNRWDY